jgi:uncharacterized Zn-binding protein involved in type VI secretion
MSFPAARLTDMHVCPMITVLVPHVGGPIAGPGAPTTLIAGLPAARVTDMCVCVGPPDVIALGSFTVLIGGLPAARVSDMTAHGGVIAGPGCLTVLIGDSGGGAGSPAAFTMAAARAAGAAFTRTTCAAEGVMEQVKGSPLLTTPDPDKKSWIEIELVDQKGKPVPHERYRVVPPDKKPVEGYLDEKGFARVGGIDAGSCTISFPDLDAATWTPEKGDPGRRATPVPVQPKYRPDVRTSRLEAVVSGRPSIKTVTLSRWNPARPGIGAVDLTIVSLRPGVAKVELAVVGRPGVAGVTLALVSRPGIGSVRLELI